MTGAPLIELRNVTVVRDLDRSGRPALDDVSLSLDAREHICILGPNGCGKSTLIKTITRECYPLARPGSSVRILGRERWNVFELRARLGIVSADLHDRFVHGSVDGAPVPITGLDAVVSGFFSSRGVFTHHFVGAGMRDAARRTLDRLGVPHLAGVRLDRMSTGEARRVLIARALVHDPESLLFDEPGNALDIAAHAALVDTMSQLARAGIGVVLVTHHVSEIIPEIERVVLLREGRVFGDGPKREMLTSERLSALFGIDVDVRRDGERYSVEPRPRTDTIDRGSS